MEIENYKKIRLFKKPKNQLINFWDANYTILNSCKRVIIFNND